MARSEPPPMTIVGLRAVAEERGYVLAEAVSAGGDEVDIVILAAGAPPAWPAPVPGPPLGDPRMN